MRPLLLCLLAAILLAPLHAAEPPPQGERQKAKGDGAPASGKPLSPSALRLSPFFKPGDVIALVGGEDMVVASEYGYLELLLTRALPDHHLRFRNLAWEGDTVFEQRRDLNFPSYEDQLDKIGATVVIAQFGQMESLAGKEKLPEFIAAYEKLIERFSAGGKRRVVLLPLVFSESPSLKARADYNTRLNHLSQQKWVRILEFTDLGENIEMSRTDRIHLNKNGHMHLAAEVGLRLGVKYPIAPYIAEAEERFRQLIIAKNRLWFDYWRPQNWAFLAGDRTAQPSSRDHLDPSKRWFPPEREAFLPLIEAKEKEIDALAAQLAAGNAGK